MLHVVFSNFKKHSYTNNQEEEKTEHFVFRWNSYELQIEMPNFRHDELEAEKSYEEVKRFGHFVAVKFMK